MRVDFFTIPAMAGEEAAAEMNRLLSSARILTVDRQFVADGASSFWSICVTMAAGALVGDGDRSNARQRSTCQRARLMIGMAT